jgi:hypothetical protein
VEVNKLLLLEMFPDVDETAIHAQLVECGDDMQKVADLLLRSQSQSFDEPRMRSPVVCFGRSRFCTAASASTIASDDMSSTNVEADVTGIFRIGLNTSPVVGLVHASCGNGPSGLLPL